MENADLWDIPSDLSPRYVTLSGVEGAIELMTYHDLSFTLTIFYAQCL